MNIYIRDVNLRFVGIIDSYSSIIWANRYFDTGDFELCVPAAPSSLNLLRPDYYLCREDDNAMMIVEKHELEVDNENGDYFIITGRDLKSILDRRIVWQQTILSGTVEDCIRRLVTENCISPSVPTRKINHLVLGKHNGFSETINIQITGDNLLEVLKEICKTYEYGFDIVFDGKNFVFELYKGVDRSDEQLDNSRVTFSHDFDNIRTSKYSFNKQKYKNVALVAGEGEGLVRKTHVTYLENEPSDLSRRELYVDARDISSNEGSISPSDYNNLLAQKGKDALSENTIIHEFDGEVDPTQTYLYKRDYFLGDVVNVINEYGISTTPRILEIIENEDENGYNVLPTFSKWEV